MVKAVRQAREIAREAAGVAGRKGSRVTSGGRPDRDAKREARKTALLEAAIEAVRRDGPGVSMDQMAASAGVTKPILYRHFHDRAGLVTAIAEYAFRQIATGLDTALHTDETPRQVVASTIDVYLRFIESDTALYRFLVHRTIVETDDPSAVLTDYIARAGRQVALVLGEGLRAAGLDSGPAEPWAFGIVGMVHSAGDWWIETRTMPRERLAEYLTSLVYDGFPDLAGADGTRAWMPADTTAAAPTGPTAVAGDDRNPDRGITPLRTPRRRSS
jgi:AcrR family transcriptional regulator